jgi:SAM-dependent methyltransferase
VGGRGVDPVAATGFDLNAADYERGRPGYAREIAELLVTKLDVAPGSAVCDLAAGTGKFTRILVDRGFDVVAVEPVAGMRAQLADVLPDVRVVDGTAEQIPLPDGSIDAVTVAQAFHWFDHAAACAEMRRVLRPGAGGALLVWNRRDESVPWIRSMSEVLDWHAHSQSAYERSDWGEVLVAGGFVDGGYHELRVDQTMTRELLAARVRSISYVGELPAAEQDVHVANVLALVDDQPDEFPMPYRTMIWWARTPPP